MMKVRKDERKSLNFHHQRVSEVGKGRGGGGRSIRAPKTRIWGKKGKKKKKVPEL